MKTNRLSADISGLRRYLMDRCIKFRDDLCWDWALSKNDHGYGRCRWMGQYEYAHRMSFLAFIGPIPSGMCVCHKCDNTSCINPKHLFLGTHADNMRDMVGKGRQNKGTRNGGSKLGSDDVEKLRFLNTEMAMTGAFLGEVFGISTAQARRIINRELWREETP